jgi:hypothetical protein
LADLCAVYDALTDAEKAAYEGLRIQRSFKAPSEMQGRPSAYHEEEIDDVVHPMVSTTLLAGTKRVG